MHIKDTHFCVHYKIEILGITYIFELYQHDLSVVNLDLKDEYKSYTNKMFDLYDKILERI